LPFDDDYNDLTDGVATLDLSNSGAFMFVSYNNDKHKVLAWNVLTGAVVQELQQDKGSKVDGSAVSLSNKNREKYVELYTSSCTRSSNQQQQQQPHSATSTVQNVSSSVYFMIYFVVYILWFIFFTFFVLFFFYVFCVEVIINYI
jgi:Fe2+ transport system protein B